MNKSYKDNNDKIEGNFTPKSANGIGNEQEKKNVLSNGEKANSLHIIKDTQTSKEIEQTLDNHVKDITETDYLNLEEKVKNLTDDNLELVNKISELSKINHDLVNDIEILKKSMEFKEIESEEYKKDIHDLKESYKKINKNIELELLNTRNRYNEQIKQLRMRTEEELTKTRNKFSERLNNELENLKSYTKNFRNESQTVADIVNKEKELLNITLKSIGDGVIATDKNANITLINKFAENFIGWKEKEVIGQPLDEIFNIANKITREKCNCPATESISTGNVVGLKKDTVLITKDGNEKFVSATCSPIYNQDGNIMGATLVFRDITSRMRMEEDILKAQKLDSISILASGIAHDFNNILTGIMGNISLSKLFINPKDKIYNRLTESEKACQKASDLTRKLITFSDSSTPVKKITSIKELARNSAALAARGSKVEYEFSIPENLWSVEIDQRQISQVIYNLLLNSQEAMPNGGTIYINIENVSFKGPDTMQFKDGNYIKFSIRDEGIGIPSESLSKIFDPYFTTGAKKNGLGLSTSYTIIKNHNGFIDVESKLNEGTTFNVYLPANNDLIILLEELEFEKDVILKEIIGKKGRILVMDDDRMVREIAGDTLNHIGYEVEFAENGDEACELYKSSKSGSKPIDAVILELTVENGPGAKETIGKILEIDPNARVIVSSSYDNDPVVADFASYGFKGYVKKPFRIEELSKVVIKVVKDNAGQTVS